MRRYLAGASLTLLAGILTAQISAPETKLIANRGHSNPALNGFCYFYNTAPDILNGGSQPAALSGGNIETFDCDFNPASSTGEAVVILTENVSNSFIVCRADNGSQLHVLPNANVGLGQIDPIGLAISEDGVLFITNRERAVAYRASDAPGAQQVLLFADSPTGSETGDSSGIHCTGSVAAGNCRLYLSVNSNIRVYNITGSLPNQLQATLVTEFAPKDGSTGFVKPPAISGTRDLLHIIDNASEVREAVTLDPGADQIPGTVDDTYLDAQAIADNQITQNRFPTGLAVLDSGSVNVGLIGATTGVYALFDATGEIDNVFVGSLGTASTPGTLVPAANGVQNDAGVLVDEDYDNNGSWDGGKSSSTGLVGSKATGAISVARFHGEINVWFTSTGAKGGFGRLVLPQSTVPVSLSAFTLE